MNWQKFLALLKYDVFVAVLPLLAKMLTADAANTDPINLALQWNKFQVEVIAAAPSLEADAFTALAQLVNGEVQTLLTQAAKAAGVPAG
jgi:hypothetical protein